MFLETLPKNQKADVNTDENHITADPKDPPR